MSAVILCPAHCEDGRIEVECGHEYSGMGGGSILTRYDECPECDGRGTVRCAECREDAIRRVDGAAMCEDCAAEYEREAAA